MSLKEKISLRAQELGISPKRSLGQNFLIGQHVVDRILEAVKQLKSQGIIEVGPGLGSLTEALISDERPLMLIELDSTFSQYWRDRGLQVVETDALKWDWTLVPWEEATLVSNLPYQISSSIVIDRSLGPDSVTSMVLMFQREVADRIVAKVSSSDYGLLSVIAQNYWQVSVVVDAGPREFWPQPQVTSRVLSFKRKEVDSAVGRPQFLQFVKNAFAQRRKLVAKNLSGYPAVAEILRNHGFDPTRARAEEINPDQFMKIFRELRAK